MKIDWAAYGTKDLGHALLGASGSFNAASELTQFTDRPGNPPSGQAWGPVTSGFPFKGFYIVLRTMPDAHAKRSGMVRSYAAFLPLEAVEKINSLMAVVAAMPSDSDFEIRKEMSPLVVSEQLSPSIQTNSNEFEKTITGLSAPEIEQPVVWGSDSDYLPTLEKIWSKIPTTLRQKFSFAFQFAPDHPFPVPCAFVATYPGFANRWGGRWHVDGTPSQTEIRGGIIEWFENAAKESDLDELIQSYGLKLQTFQELRILEQFSALVRRRDGLSFEELTKTVRILERLSDGVEIPRDNARLAIFRKFYELMPTVSFEEILTLRNLKSGSLPELIEPAKDALETWLYNNESTCRADDLVQVIEAAIDAPDNWWSQPFIAFIKGVVSQPSLRNAKRLLQFVLRSDKVMIFSIDRFGFGDTRWENVISDILPEALTEANRSNTIFLSIKQKWYRVTAYCLSKLEDRPSALSAYITSSVGSSDGLYILLQEWGFLGLLQTADEMDSTSTLAFLSSNMGGYLDKISDSAILRLKNPFLVFGAAIENETGPLHGKMRKYVSMLIEHNGNPEVSAAALKRDVSILFDLEKPVTAFNTLAEEMRPVICHSFSEAVADGFLCQRLVSDNGKESWAPLLDLDVVSQRLVDVPFAGEGLAPIAAFALLDGLTDEHCARWLAEYFRVSNEKGGVGDATRNGIIDLLLNRDFPRAAQIVKETVEQFQRGDARPILEAIRERYQGLTTKKKEIRSMEKLTKIFIATALPLEYEAVKSYLSDREYDQDLEADFGLWPSSDSPLVIIYLSITGAGNLSSQASALEIFRRVKPDCAFFMGIGGGIKDLSIGDVAYGTQVDYIEGGKESGKGVYASRPKTEQTNRKLVSLAHRIASDAKGAKGLLRISYTASPAVIVSGENVLGSKEDEAVQFQIVKKHYNDGQVIEMEGFGFMSAARSYHIEFCMVIRGISDLCKGKEADTDVRDQPLAAKNATDFLFRLLPECLPLVTPKGRWNKIKNRLVAWKNSFLSR